VTKRLSLSALYSASGAAAYGVAVIVLDLLLAKRYGLTGQAAVFQAANQIPATLVTILSGGAILGPLLPLVGRLLHESPQQQTGAFLTRVSGFLLLLQGAVVVLAWLFAPWLVRLIASGFPAELLDETENVLRWLLPGLLFNGLASIAIASLLAARHVLLANLAPMLLPLAGIASSLFWDVHGARWIAWGYLAGGVVQVAGLAWFLRRDRLSFLPPAWPRGEAMADFIRTFLATALAHAALSAVLLLNMAIAGSLSERDLAAFGYGSKLILLALAFLTSLVNNVGLPYLADLAHSQGHAVLFARLRSILLMTGGVGLTLALTWFPLADWVVSLVYARGSFSAADTAAVAAVQRIFVLQAPFYMVGVVCWRALNVTGSLRPLVAASLAALVVDIAVAALLAPRYQVEGVAAAYAASVLVWSVMLLSTLWRQGEGCNT
jgi:putative peptidoglycan lipid II flippase